MDSYNETFVMNTSKKGSAGMNPECNNEVANVTTTKLSTTVWDLKATSKKCTVVITGDYNFDPGSCTSATGTLTIPGVGMLPYAKGRGRAPTFIHRDMARAQKRPVSSAP